MQSRFDQSTPSVRSFTQRWLLAAVTLAAVGCAGDDTTTPADDTGTTGEDSGSMTTMQPTTAQPTTAEPTTMEPDSSGTADTVADTTAGDTVGMDTTDGGDVCGNDTIEGGEACDGTDLGTEDCASQGFLAGDLACADDCTLDTSACVNAVCGDDMIDGDEDCDGLDLAGEDCISQGADAGTLACGDDCAFDTTGCIMFMCGNDLLEGTETCDGAELDGETCATQGFEGGTLACNANCMGFDDTGCFACGDDVIGGAETCDGAALAGETCLTQGFDEGTLGCAVDCSDYDTSGCAMCGDGSTNGTETCDGADVGAETCGTQGFAGGTLGCAADCGAYDTSACTTCGDDTVDGADFCDGTDLNGETCTSLGFVGGGTLACTGNCGAYDVSGCVNAPVTICSTPGTSIGPGAGVITMDTIAAGFGPFVGDVNVSINATHTFVADMDVDVRHVESGTTVRLLQDQCAGGDNVDATFDQAAAAGPTCTGTPSISGTILPFGSLDAFTGLTPAGSDTWELVIADDASGDGGVLVEWCVTVDSSPINPLSCGDNVLSTGEACDGASLGGQTCVGQGFDGGVLACDAACNLDTSGCTTCGDGNASGSEACDGADLQGQTCAGLGYLAGGTLACSGACGFDTTACDATEGVCGDGVITADLVAPDESCDNNELAGTQCTDLGFVGGSLDCDSVSCQYDTADCSNTVIAVCSTPGATLDDITPSIADTLAVLDAGTITDVDIFLDVTHAYMGDVDVTLTNEATGTSIDLISDRCLSQDDGFVSLNDEGAAGGPDCVIPVAWEGNLQPDTPLSAFDGEAAAGDWTLTVTDDFPTADDGVFNGWCIYIEVAP